jgi:hypothetical protein
MGFKRGRSGCARHPACQSSVDGGPSRKSDHWARPKTTTLHSPNLLLQFALRLTSGHRIFSSDNRNPRSHFKSEFFIFSCPIETRRLVEQCRFRNKHSNPHTCYTDCGRSFTIGNPNYEKRWRICQLSDSRKFGIRREINQINNNYD